MTEDDEEDEDDDYTFGPRPKQEDNQAPMLSKFYILRSETFVVY